MSTTKEIVHQGWLTKSPPTKGIFRPRWRRRWFILKSGSYPNQFVLEYFTDESCRRQKGKINLDECEQIVGPLSVQDRNRYTFHLRTPSRTYYLAADSEDEMNKWVKGLCQVCCLKTMEEEGDGHVVYVKPSNENNKPVEPTEGRECHNESNGSSPTPSNKSPSGPYIPISECFTGKPIIFNPTNGEDVTYYNTSSFPFPPKVNWVTYPHKRDPKDGSEETHNDGKIVQRPNDISYVPPRPPKKNSSMPTTPTKTTAQPKTIDQATIAALGHSAGVYENVEENQDLLPPTPTLHSPPGSAGLYCNISDATDNKTGGNAPQPASSPSPSCTSSSSNSAIPPKVDRNLKPNVKKASDIVVITTPTKTHHHPSSNSQSRCMTLPNKSSQSNFHGCRYFPGPNIDRTRKPSDGHVTLNSPPSRQHQSAAHNNSRNPKGLHSSTSTLPNSSRGTRMAGPIISPHEKRTLTHQDDDSQAMIVYIPVDCPAFKESEARSPTAEVTNKKALTAAPPESVEYTLIDHNKTMALNQMRVERNIQLTTPLVKH